MSRVSLEGQVAVVTGAARGVGELLARKLSARGAKVALVGLEPDERLSRQAPGSRPHRRGLRVFLNPTHGPLLRSLPYDLAWATTWMNEANEMIAPVIGLPPDLPFIAWPELFATDPDGLYWKTRPLLAWAAGRPFAWVDDMITDLDEAYVRAHHDARVLLVRVHPRRGLRDADFTRLTHWATSA
ncbi:hypothetical protein ABZ726_21735 [Streptomyces hundungensis]|uniref:hypothetical protein n=1 Tax=Streptomyces hundungensis TaxID=1077946 RepID=UPI0033C3B47D